MFCKSVKSCNGHGFTLVELLVASGIVSILTVMISVIICNTSKVVALQKDVKSIEGNIILNDIRVLVNNIDDIVLSERSNDAKKVNNLMYFEIDEMTKSSLGFLFLSYDNDNVACMFFDKNKKTVSVQWDHVIGNNVWLGKYLILADNAKDCYLRPLYTKKFFEKKSKTNWKKGDFKKIDSWNNNKKIHLSYDNIKKLQEMKKKGEIAGVQLVVEKE